MGANAFWNSFGSASAMTLTLAIFVGQVAPPVLTVTASPTWRRYRRETGNHTTTNRCLPTISIIGSPRAHHRAGLTRTLPTTPSIIESKLGILIERDQLLQGAVGLF